MSRVTLIFVYNADSGLMNAVMDSMHKIISPKTYSCSLCKITYGAFTEIPEWKKFRENFSGTMHFYHIDEFEARYGVPDQGKQYSYPVVFTQQDDEALSILLSTEKLNAISDLDELIEFFKDWVKPI